MITLLKLSNQTIQNLIIVSTTFITFRKKFKLT